MEIVPVILSGGAGTRLWPLSRRSAPKQLQALVGPRTLLQETARRAAQVEGAGAPVVVCGTDQVTAIGEQLAAVGSPPRLMLAEPEGRNTAPAIGAAAHALAGSDPVLAALPADHLIADVPAFVAAVEAAATLARDGHLVTFGIAPERPETGYGYIEWGDPIGPGFRVNRFVEKPDLPTAVAYLAAGTHWWNSGIFLFRASVYLAELDRRQPAMAAAVAAAWEGRRGGGSIVTLGQAFGAAPALSIDHAVMEHTDRAVVVPLRAGWSDLGSFEALWEVGERDAGGNVVVGDVLAAGVTGSYLRSSHRLVAVLGLDGVVVVETPDAVLVSSRERSQEIKAIAERLAAEGRPEQ